MHFTYTISIDDDYTPWGEPEIIEEETQKINDMEWAPYVVTVHAAGPIDASEALHGCVVSLTDTGTYHDVAAIEDLHLQEVAEEVARQIESVYLGELISKRDEIDAMIKKLSVA